MYRKEQIASLNQDILKFDVIHPIEEDMIHAHTGVSRMVMIDRYALKDTKLETLKVGDIVVLTLREDPTYPARGIGEVTKLDNGKATVQVFEDYLGQAPDLNENNEVTREFTSIEKPLELFYEQIAKRNAQGLAEVENNEEKKEEVTEKFYNLLRNKDFVPAGRVLYGAGSGADVTYFNCYVLPFPKDSRDGLSEHRTKATEIMSRGGGVGTNGSTLRPRNTLARGVNGKSSGAVSWLDDLSKLTHLIEQGGSRRGAQMIMMADWHPDIVEFIVSKMQNARILRFISENTEDEQIKEMVDEKLKFTPLNSTDKDMFENIRRYENMPGEGGFSGPTLKKAKQKLADGGDYSVQNPDFLTGANISVAVTNDFMEAVKEDAEWSLRFPDTDNYDEETMAFYDENWHDVGDVRKWEEMGYAIKEHRTIKARELWKLINICATYAAEPGIFFIDKANEDTNAQAYGQKVVATNPCGEQPLAGYSVCNLAAVNLAEHVNKDSNEVDYEKLTETVKTGVRMQDNVIDATPYFLEENKKQALGERRVGLGVMGLADMLIYTENRYGSVEGNKVVDKVFETIAVAAYEESIELAKERGSFTFLIGETDEETQELRQKFIDTGYMSRMPEHIREGVLEHGIRNSHLLTVAPK